MKDTLNFLLKVNIENSLTIVNKLNNIIISLHSLIIRKWELKFNVKVKYKYSNLLSIRDEKLLLLINTKKEPSK